MGYNGTEEMSLEKHGCTTPYGPNKTKICTDANKGEDALWSIYQRFMYSHSDKKIEKCYYPCSYFLVSTKLDKVFEGEAEGGIGILLTFEQLIQLTKSYYTYSELSLIAEVGGYVGLFLGISVNQAPYLLKVLKASLERIRSLLKF